MARNEDQNTKMKEEKRELILKESLKLFALKGLNGTKIKDIAEKVGMAQGLLYHYYKSKEEIYIEILHNAMDKLIQGAEYLAATELPAHEKIRFSITEIMKVIESSEDFNQTCRFIAQATNTKAISPDDEELLNEKREKPYQIISEVMAAGQREGTIVDGDPKQLAVLYWTMVNGLAIYSATRDPKPTLPNAELLIKTFIK